MSNVFDYKNLTPFKFYILQNFPYIEQDFDALTDYQLMCKLAEKMNEVINTVNMSGEQVESLTVAFNNLKNYVDSYFENLDVQDEINNKLNQMANDGTLANILDANVLNNFNQKLNDLDNRIDATNNTLSQIGTASPKGAYNTLSELQTAYPTGAEGIFVVKENNSWYFWNGSAWTLGGNYNQAISTFPNYADTNYYDIDNMNSIGDNQIYVLQPKTPPQFVNYIEIKTATAGNDGKVCICFKNDIYFFPYKTYNFVSVENGYVKIPVNLYIPHDFYIIVQCTSIYFKNAVNGKYWNIPNFPTGNTPVPVTVEKSGIELAVNINLNLSYNMENKLKNINYGLIIPSLTKAITFNFTTLKCTITQFVLNFNNINNGITTIQGQTLDIPQLSLPSVNDYTNYYLIYSYLNKQFRIIRQIGNEYVNIDSNNDYLICSFTIHNYLTTNIKQPPIYIHSLNSDYVDIIFTATSESQCLQYFNSKNTLNSWFSGKIYKALGDSITRGEDPENEYNPMLNNRYTDIVAKSTGMLAINFGVGGSTIADREGRNDSFYQRRDVGGATLYTIFGGVNDYKANIPLGTFNDTVTTTFYGAFKQLAIYFANAGAKFFVITPLHCQNDTVQNTQGLILEDYVNAILYVCKYYGIPVLDLFNSSNLNPRFQFVKSSYMPDGLHPNKLGMRLIGNQIASFAKNLLNVGSNQDII